MLGAACPSSSVWLQTCLRARAWALWLCIGQAAACLVLGPLTQLEAWHAQDYLDQVQNRTKEKRYTFDVAFDATVRAPQALAGQSVLGR